jgi:anthranilate phosphoribosyltransferase
LTAVERAQEQLRTVLDNSESTPEQIKAQLTALRTAKEKTKQELAAAQQELRKIITIRQEAILVMMGTLD